MESSGGTLLNRRILLLAFILSCRGRGCDCSGDRSCGKPATASPPEDDIMGSSSDLTAQEVTDVVEGPHVTKPAFRLPPLDPPSGILRPVEKPRPPPSQRPSFLIAKPFRDQRR